MATVTFELNDYELRLFRDGILATTSTGYALVDEAGVRLGEDALRRFRLHPRSANNLFWQRMNMEALPVPGPGAAHHADLVYLHLAQIVDAAGIGDDDEIIIAAPGNTTPDQLGLLLGITNELKLNVTGLVDAAVAMAAATALRSDGFHLDVALHRATLTGIEAGAEEVARTSCEDLMELGLIHLLDSWLSVVADRFVEQTRFDPLRVAETEQQLYDQMIQWLEDPGHGDDLTISIQYKGNAHRVDTTLALLEDKALQRYQVLSRRPVAGRYVLLSHRAGRLPGLGRFLEQAGARVEIAGPAQVAQGVGAHVALIRSDPEGLRFVSALPRSAQVAAGGDVTAAPAQTAPTAPQAPLPVPTHALHDAIAIAIGDGLALGRAAFAGKGRAFGDDFPEGRVRLERGPDGIRLVTADRDLVRVNGTPAADGRPLSNGDRLEIAGHEFTLITVDTS